MGMICSTVANCHRSEGRDPFKPSDFIPSSFCERQEEQTPEDLLLKVRALNAALGGKDLTAKDPHE